MNNVVITAEDAYLKFRLGIRYQHTSEVPEDDFNMYWNDAQLAWAKGKLLMPEFVQKHIDDLEQLRIVTDGDMLGQSYAPINENDPGIFDIPKSYTVTTGNILMSGSYPLYLHGLNCMFKKTDDTDWIGAKVLRSDNRSVMGDNPYRKPSATRIYFELIKGQIRRVGGNSEDQLRLEYIRYPKIMTFVDGGTSVDPEFNPTQNTEITELAIRTFLENRTNPRYKSFMQEMILKSQGN